MTVREKLIQKVFKDLANLRKAEQFAAETKSEQAFAIPEIADCDAKYRKLGFEVVKLEAEGKNASELRQKQNEIANEFDFLLTKHGFDKAEFTPVFQCPLCFDTGKVGDSFCDCFKTRFLAEVKAWANLSDIAPFTFDDCNFDKISSSTQREFLMDTYKKAKTYCKMFNLRKTQNMLLSGSTGTGKTCVASAIANELVSRGVTVTFVSAFELLQQMKECHFSFPEERDAYLEDFLTVDLLVIDDLGVEQMLRNITCEYLLLILCERERHGKSTIVTTNLGDKLIPRYGDRITSRLTNQRNTVIRIFDGNDMRNSSKRTKVEA